MAEIRSIEPKELGTGRTWITNSKTRPGIHHTTVFADDGSWLCTCEGMQYFSYCRHVRFLKELVGIDDDLDDDFHVSM